MEPIKINFRDQIARNKTKSYFLMLLIFVTFIALAYVITLATAPGYFFIIMIFGIIFSLSYLLLTYYNSDKISIASVGAKKATRANYPDYHRLVEGLAIAAGLPKPKLYIMHTPNINAFASGRDPNHAVICVTDGALDQLERRELEAVLSHELGHIANYDIKFMTLVTVMVGLIAIVSQIFLRSLWFSGGREKSKEQIIFMVIGIVMAILAPIAVYLIQMSISRKREFSADATAVKFTRNPEPLIKALEKIGKINQPEKKLSKAVAPMFFANPFKNIGSTHPPIEKRIEALKRM
ncbi:M48 family metallopeptidase [Candidatus Pacearchaeota archaeon]|nr:M48 family metallopeptidase [Candidatus Pacearchaeota archaeon]